MGLRIVAFPDAALPLQCYQHRGGFYLFNTLTCSYWNLIKILSPVQRFSSYSNSIDSESEGTA